MATNSVATKKSIAGSNEMPMKAKNQSNQHSEFEKAARALECDESEERFDAALKKVAAHKPIEGETRPSMARKENDRDPADK